MSTQYVKPFILLFLAGGFFLYLFFAVAPEREFGMSYCYNQTDIHPSNDSHISYESKNLIQVANKTHSFKNPPDPCDNVGYLTVFDGGRLGNQMTQYATLLAHASRLGVGAVISTKMSKELKPHFKNISIPVEPAKKGCPWNWKDIDQKTANTLTVADLQGQNLRIGTYIMDLLAFKFFQYQLISQEFAFSPQINYVSKQFLKDASREFLKRQNLTGEIEVIFVSIHVRRTDYKQWLSKRVEGELVSSQYIRAAMDVFTHKYETENSKVLFIMASDDSKWCQKLFSNDTNVVLTSTFQSQITKQQPTFDMALPTHCNHSIVSYGTFGFWTAFLKRSGDVILASGTSKVPTFLEHSVRLSLPRWTFLQDPCYFKDDKGNVKLKDDCL